MGSYQPTYTQSQAIVIAPQGGSQESDSAWALALTLSRPPYLFDVMPLIGEYATHDDLSDAVAAAYRLDSDSRLLVAYSGPAIIHQGLLHITPVDADPADPDSLIALDYFLPSLRIAAKHTAYILDADFPEACFSLNGHHAARVHPAIYPRRRAHVILGAGPRVGYSLLPLVVEALSEARLDPYTWTYTFHDLIREVYAYGTRRAGYDQYPFYGHLPDSQAADFVLMYEGGAFMRMPPPDEVVLAPPPPVVVQPNGASAQKSEAQIKRAQRAQAKAAKRASARAHTAAQQQAASAKKVGGPVIGGIPTGTVQVGTLKQGLKQWFSQLGPVRKVQQTNKVTILTIVAIVTIWGAMNFLNAVMLSSGSEAESPRSERVTENQPESTPKWERQTRNLVPQPLPTDYVPPPLLDMRDAANLSVLDKPAGKIARFHQEQGRAVSYYSEPLRPFIDEQTGEEGIGLEGYTSSDFIMTIGFVNPIPADDAEWAYVVRYRTVNLEDGNIRGYEFRVTDSGQWEINLMFPSRYALLRGPAEAFTSVPGGMNSIMIIADGDNGEFYVNHNLVWTFVYPHYEHAGDFWFGLESDGTALKTGKPLELQYRSFALWGLEAP